MKRLLCLLTILLHYSLGIASDVTPTANVVINPIPYEHIVWRGIPISVVVPVGVERILKFPNRVSLHNQDPLLTTDKVSLQNNAGFIYIKAKKSFTAIRLSFVMNKTGKVVLIDLSAKASADDTPVSIVIPDDKQPNEMQPYQHPTPAFINYVTLMRYAIQHLYAPERFIENHSAFNRAPMYTSKSVMLFNNDNVMALPQVSWQADDLYVTAVLLKNLWKQTIYLDPDHLQGRWLASSFYPSNRMAPAGSRHDRATIFLISDQPFHDALKQIKDYS